MNKDLNVAEGINMSVVRAMDILELMNTSSLPMTVADICRALSLNRITCTNLIKTLISKKYLYKNEKGMVCLTGKIYVMGQIFKEGFPIVEMFNTYAEEITKEFGCISHLVTFAGLNQGILLSQAPRDSIYADSLHLYVPLYCTGAGKVLLAHQPENVIQSVVSSIDMVAYTDNTITDKEHFISELNMIKTQGYGIDNCEFKAGLYCVSAPIFTQTDTIRTAVSLTHLKINSAKEIDQYVPRVKELATVLSHASGYRNLNLDSL